jgi:hypothetical protein
LAKGLKGDYEPIKSWYQDILNNVPTLFRLIEQDDKSKSLLFALRACKPGLISKNAETAEWSCKLFVTLGNELVNRNLLPLAWDWFIAENGGLHFTIMCMKRHVGLRDYVVDIVNKFARDFFVETYTFQIFKILTDVREFVPIAHDILRVFLESNSFEVNIYSQVNPKTDSIICLVW